MKKAATATYLYCVVKSAATPKLSNRVTGLAGMRRPRLLDAGASLWLVVADAPLSRYGEAPIEAGLRDLKWVSSCAVAHEHVIESAAAGGAAVIPMKLFTLFASDDRALRHILAARRVLDAAIKRVAGCREWGVRVHLNPPKGTAISQRTAGAASGKASPGTHFLMARKQAKDSRREMQAQAIADTEKAYRLLARSARDSRRHPPVPDQTAGITLDAAFLVPRKAEERFRKVVARLSALPDSVLRVTLTGPWPPYNFAGSAR